MSNQVMTLEQLDQLLTQWGAKRVSASKNVLELMDHPTFKHLTGTGGFIAAKLTGVTDARCTPAVKALNELWGLFAEMGKVLDLAQTKRNALKSRPKAAELAEIQELLTGPSVKFSVRLTFAERSLLSPAEVSQGMTLERVMDTMVKAYDGGKVVVLEVAEATDRMQHSLQASLTEVTNLQATAQSLGEGGLPELDLVSRKSEELKGLIDSDPLGVKGDFATAIEPVLKQARDRIEGLKDLYDQIVRDVTLARTTMASIKATHEKAKQALAERELKVWLANADTLPRPPEDSVISGLEEWLVRLENSLAQNKWKPLRMGVANWSLQATERLLACQQACTANLEPLNRRQELRAYLDALKAKAETFGRSEDLELAAIERVARALLYTRPTRMAEAEAKVKEYADNLR